MKTMTLTLSIGVLAACSSPTDEQAAQPAVTTPAAPVSQPTQPAISASTTGIVTAVDPAAGKITIAHGPVPELEWPAMTMTFQAPKAELGAIRQGDRVSFEFTTTGMNGTIISLRRSPLP